MATKIRKWGNSLGVRIPQDIAEETGMTEGKEIVFVKRGQSLTIEAATPTESLDELVRRITPKNKHGEIDFGAPKGKEVW